MKKAIRLTAKQAERYNLIKGYIKETKDSLCIGDNDAIQGTCIDKIDVLKTVINVYFYSFSRGRKVKEQIEKSDINHIYNRAIKNDDSFKIYAESERGKTLDKIKNRTALSHALAEKCAKVFDEYEQSSFDFQLFCIIDEFLQKHYDSKD